MKYLIKFLILPLFIIFFISNASANNKIKIGLVVPLSGENKDLGESILKSVRLAINDINDNKIVILPKDNQNKPLTYLNVVNGKDMTIKDLALLIADIVEYKGKIIWDKTKPDGTPRKQLSIGRIKALGWEPKISLREGLKSTIEVFKTLKF